MKSKLRINEMDIFSNHRIPLYQIIVALGLYEEKHLEKIPHTGDKASLDRCG